MTTPFIFRSLPQPVADTLTFMNLDNPLNIVLLLLSLYLLKSTLWSSTPEVPTDVPDTPVEYNWRPKKHPETLVWRSWTPQELRSYDGTTTTGSENGRILFAIRRKVYDVSSGRNFYGPDGPYAIFAGRDCSRGMAKQSFEADMLTPVDEPIDDLKDLTTADWDNLRNWEDLFEGKYIMCGDLVES